MGGRRYLGRTLLAVASEVWAQRHKEGEILTPQKVALQVLRVQVCLSTVRARELSIGILDRNHRVLGISRTGGGRSRPARSAWEDAAATLGSNNVGRLLLGHGVVEHRVGRRNARLRHDATGGHGTQDRRSAAASRCGSDGLRVRRSGRGLRHHGGRGTIARVRRVRVLCHGVKARATSGLGGLLVGGWQVVARVGRVRRSWGSRSVRVASIEGLHGGSRWLQRRQRLRQRRTGLQLVRRDGGRRRIGLGGRCVYTIGGIVVVTVHATARKYAVRVFKSARATQETESLTAK
jgi:hypothetical protein